MTGPLNFSEACKALHFPSLAKKSGRAVVGELVVVPFDVEAALRRHMAR